MASSAHRERVYVGRRHHSRLRLGIPASLTFVDGIYRVVLLDLSQTGARIATARQPRPGLNGVIESGDLDAFCTVVWSDARYCGVAFELPLPARVMIAMRDFADTFPIMEREAFRRDVRNWVRGAE